MSDSLFLLKGDRAITKMSSSPFDKEDIFQGLLEQFPELLTDSDLGEGTARRWVLVSREIAVADKEGGSGRWSLDHLFLDQDGIPTLVEVKRASDTRARREVVAQMLDYAANAVRWWRIEDIRELFEQRCARDNDHDGKTPEIALKQLLGTDDIDSEAFWRAVQANLQSGRIRMLFVADLIAPELQSIIEFLNEQMREATVLGLELRPYADGVDRLLVPRIIGLTSRASAQKSTGKPSTAKSTEEWLQTVLDQTALPKVNEFLRRVRAIGGEPIVARQSLAIVFGASDGAIRALYVRPGGRVTVAFYMLIKSSKFKDENPRAELWKRFEHAGFKLSTNRLEGDSSFNLPELNEIDAWSALEKIIRGMSDALGSTSTKALESPTAAGPLESDHKAESVR